MAPTRFYGMLQQTGVRSVNNLWSGYELSSKGKKAAWGVLGTYAAYRVIRSGNDEIRNAVENYNLDQGGVQSLPSTRADGIGYTASPGGYKDSMLPTGDLVFALHNLRHGG